MAIRRWADPARLTCVALLGTTIAAGPATAQQSVIDRVVDRGHDLSLGFYGSLDDDCHFMGYARVELLGSPGGGSIYTQRVRKFPEATKLNPKPVCPDVRVPGTRVFYRPAPGFVGRDDFHLRVTWVTGTVKTFALSVQVR